MDNLDLLSPDPRPTRADAVKNREVLLTTAQELFDHEGVDNVTMTQIAQSAGVGKGTLYRHFNNKSELCHALLDQDMRDLQASTLRNMRESDDVEETLRWFVDRVSLFVYRHEDLLFSGLETSPDLSLEFDAHLWWRQTIRGMLRQMHMVGDVDYMTDVIYIMLDVNTLRFQRRSLGYDRQRVVDGLNALIDRLLHTRPDGAE